MVLNSLLQDHFLETSKKGSFFFFFGLKNFFFRNLRVLTKTVWKHSRKVKQSSSGNKDYHLNHLSSRYVVEIFIVLNYLCRWHIWCAEGFAKPLPIIYCKTELILICICDLLTFDDVWKWQFRSSSSLTKLEMAE